MTAPLPRLSRDSAAPARPGDSVDGWLRVFIGLLRLPPPQADGIREELEGHLRDRTRDLMLTGLDEASATRHAIAELGEAADVAARYRALRTEPRRRLLMHLALFGTGAAVAMSLVAVAWSGRPQQPTQSPGPEALLLEQLMAARSSSDSTVRIEDLLAQAETNLGSGHPDPALIATLRDQIAKAQSEARQQRLEAEQTRLNAANALHQLASGSEVPRPSSAMYQPRPTESALSEVVLDLNVDDGSLQEAFKAVGAAAKRPVEVEWGQLGGAGPTTTVSLHRQRITAPRLLEVLSDQLKLSGPQAFDARIVDGVVLVSTREQFDRREETLATYDLSGIIAARQAKYNEERAAIVPEIVNAITDFVSPDDWNQNGGDLAKLQVVGDRLLVRAPARMHPQIAWILSQLPSDGRGGSQGPASSSERSLADLEQTRAKVAESLQKAIQQYGPDHRNVALLKDDLARIDQDLKTRRNQQLGELHVYRLNNRDATEVACTLRELYPDWTITPDARTNSLLVKSPAEHSDVDAAVHKLDGAGQPR
jgi:hypothetical protein